MINELIFASISLTIIYILYKRKYNTTFIPNDEYVKDDTIKLKADVYLFYADWCPYSKDAMKKWNELSEIYKNHKSFNLKFIKVNVDEDTLFADSFNIDSYPSVVLVYKNTRYTYDALLNTGTFKTFLNTFIK
jgi:thiol-disulfide isomerase/thioredoxin